MKHLKFKKFALKIKCILIIIMAVAIIGIGFFAVFIYQSIYLPSKAVKIETPEPTTEAKESPEMKYEIASVGTWQDKINWARYHIVTENPLTKEEQIKTLAEKIIKDIGAENLKLDKVEILFYHDKNVACQVEEAKAQAIWTPVELSVEILEKK